MRRVLVLCTLGMTSACVEGSVGGGLRLLIADAGASSDDATLTDDAALGPTSDSGILDGGPLDDASSIDSGIVVNPFAASTVGTMCSGTTLGNWLVLSEAPGTCAQHAAWIDGAAVDGPAAFFRLPDTMGPGTFDLPGTVCLAAGACQARNILLEVTSWDSGQGATGHWSIALEDRRAEGDLRATWCDYESASGGADTVAAGLGIGEVAFYQAVKIPVMTNGQPVATLNAPLVADRPALVRVFVRLETGYVPRRVVGRISVESPGRAPVILEREMSPSLASTDADPNTTFNFDVPAASMAPGFAYRVGIFELERTCGGPANSAVFPQTGSQSLTVREVGALKVVIVPVAYNADGSGRLPDTSSAQISKYRNVIYAQYPVPEVEIDIRDPLQWNDSLESDGDGWADLLEAIAALRSREAPSANTFYYGVFRPTDTIGAFCGRGCVAGLGYVPEPAEDYGRSAIGLGYTGDVAPGTAAHEIGHTLGRFHSPCGGVADADPAYPYNGGGIGSWGFDPVARALFPPEGRTDLMGYCDPTWISDYTYAALYTRLRYVNNSPMILGAMEEPTPMRTLIAGRRGLRWGSTIKKRGPVFGEAISMYFLDRADRVVEEVMGYAYELDHVPDRIVLIPEPPDEVAFVELPGVGRIAR